MFDFMKQKRFSFVLSFIVLFFVIGIAFAAYNPVKTPLAYKVNSGTRGYFQELNFPTGMVTADTTSGNGRNIWHTLTLNTGWTYDDGNSVVYTSNGVGLNTALPDANCSLLEVKSTTRGVLFPRMTTAQKLAITYPVAGLVVYDTDKGALCVYTDPNWETITSAAP